MTKTYYTAIDPKGVAHKRSTDRRTYTHTVVALPSYDHYLQAARSPDWAKQDRRNFEYETLIATGRDPYPYGHIEKQAEREATAKAIVAAHATAEDYVAAEQAKRIAHVEAQKAKGVFDTYVNQGWCGRPDLAAKLQANCQQGGRYVRAAILEAKEA